ncbi:MAG: AI-2E family transporter [Pirellulales bacterium]
MTRSSELIAIARGMQGASIVLFVAVLYLARDVLIPLALGGLIAFLLNPLVSRLRRIGVSNTLAVLTTATIVAIGIAGFFLAIGSSVSSFSDQIPKYRTELNKKIVSFRTTVSGWGEIVSDLVDVDKQSNDTQVEVDLSEHDQGSEIGSTTKRMDSEDRTNTTDISKDETNRKLDSSSSSKPLFIAESNSNGLNIKSWAGGAATVLGPIGTAGLVTVFAIFALLYRDDLRDRIVNVVSQGNYVVTTEAFNEASDRIGRYLLAQLMLNVGYGFAFSFGLLAIGYFFSPDQSFPFAAVLGLVAGIARFVPYLGPLVGGSLPLVLAIILFPGFKVVAAVALLIAVMELVSNNIVEPWLYGSRTGVSPMAVIIASVFWGWLWGPIGLLLATPITVCIVVMGQYVPRFHFLTTLLSDQVKVPPSVRGYQRLLDGDQFRINDFIKSEAKDQSITQLLDNTVVPTIKIVLKDDTVRNSSDDQLLENLRTALESSELLRPQSQESTKPNSEDFADHQEADKLQVVAIAVRNIGEKLTLEAISKSVEQQIHIKVLDDMDLPDREAQNVVDQRLI